jgi:hypothetical protein
MTADTLSTPRSVESSLRWRDVHVGRVGLVRKAAFACLEQIRCEFSPRLFQNSEWVATQTNAGRQAYASIRERVARALASK